MAAGAELLGGLELAGPYMFLLVGTLSAGIALGLWRLHRWARWLAIPTRRLFAGRPMPDLQVPPVEVIAQLSGAQ